MNINLTISVVRQYIANYAWKEITSQVSAAHLMERLRTESISVCIGYNIIFPTLHLSQ
jgi:hypothetical protein